MKGLDTVKVKGRVEMIPVDGPYTLLIDYAHNAVSMESLLKTLKNTTQTVLFACLVQGETALNQDDLK
ncbi:MAG: glutamate ligase domain-containing protein [Eubacteriales bacterium]